MLRKAFLIVLGAVLCSKTALSIDKNNDDGSIEKMETIVVHPENDQCCSVNSNKPATTINPNSKSRPPSSLTALINSTPSVSQNGQGGHFQNFSIRGVSRHRIKILINGMRIESDRRAGVSASFIEPLLIDTATVWRNPVSTEFGSGALGGAVEIDTKEFTSSIAATGYQSDGNENYQILGAGGSHWSIGLARRSASNANAANGSELNTQFTQYSATLSAKGKWQNLNLELFALPSIGRDMGKSNSDFPRRITHYPEEKHLLVKLGVSSDSGWKGSFYVHPNKLETEVHKLNRSLSTVSNEAFDFGVNGYFEKQIDEYTGTIALDYFSRLGVNGKEQSIDLLNNSTFNLSSLVNGKESEMAVIATLEGLWGETDWKIGTRFSYFKQTADLSASREDNAGSGFISLSHPFENGLELTANFATGFRFPSLSERFFSGTTGRGNVSGNPHLKKEQSINIDLGAQWQGDDLALGGHIFYLSVSDYIERIETEEDQLTYLNLSSGKIMGIELEGQYFLTDDLNFNWSGHLLKGEDDKGQPLSDIPANRFMLGLKYSSEQWESMIDLEMRASKDNPGNGEKRIPAAKLLSATVQYKVMNKLLLSINANNLLNEQYFNSADRKSAFAKERSVGVSVTWQLL